MEIKSNYVPLIFYFSAFFALCIAFEGFESDFKGGKLDNDTPYSTRCQVYDVGEPTRYMPFNNGSQLSFFPLTDYDTTFLIYIYIPENSMKLTIDSTMVILELCLPGFKNCKPIRGEIKQKPYVPAHQWNEVTASVNDHSKKVSFKVGNREVMSLPIRSIFHSLRGASWSAEMPKKESTKSSYVPTLYKVQFNCPERNTKGYEGSDPPYSIQTTPYTPYDFHTTTSSSHTTGYHYRTSRREYTGTDGTTEEPHHLSTPAPHVEHTTRKPTIRRSGLVGIIVAVVIAILIIIGVLIIVYRLIKKRKSLKVSEKSALKKDQADSKTGDQKGIPNQGMQD